MGSFVQKLFNVKKYCMNYFRHEIFVIYGICYFVVLEKLCLGSSGSVSGNAEALSKVIIERKLMD